MRYDPCVQSGYRPKNNEMDGEQLVLQKYEILKWIFLWKTLSTTLWEVGKTEMKLKFYVTSFVFVFCDSSFQDAFVVECIKKHE